MSYLCQRRIQSLIKHLRWSILLKVVNSFYKKIDLGYLGLNKPQIVTNYCNMYFCWKIVLDSDPHLPKKNCIICFIESPLKMMKNAFYFILKALFVLFFSWLFWSCRKNGLIRKVNFKIQDVTTWLTNNCNAHIAQYLTK